jgi:hypothetical protein
MKENTVSHLDRVSAHPTQPSVMQPTSAESLAERPVCDSLIRQYYASFNERRVQDALMFFAADATVEYLPFASKSSAQQGYTQFVTMWWRAFPDALLTIEGVEQRSDTVWELDVMATGKHANVLDLGSLGVFEATASTTRLRLTELLDIRDGRILHSSAAFNLHDITQQLAMIDYAALETRLGTIQELREQLHSPGLDHQRRRRLADRLGRELDAARFIVRPWFRPR